MARGGKWTKTTPTVISWPDRHAEMRTNAGLSPDPSVPTGVDASGIHGVDFPRSLAPTSRSSLLKLRYSSQTRTAGFHRRPEYGVDNQESPGSLSDSRSSSSYLKFTEQVRSRSGPLFFPCKNCTFKAKMTI